MLLLQQTTVYYNCNTTILLQNIKGKFLKPLCMITSGWQKVVKFAHLISKEGENKKCYVGYVF